MRMSMNFDNPVYRKTTTTVPEVNHNGSVPRVGSQLHLMDDDQLEQNRERRNSVGSGSTDEHVYQPVGGHRTSIGNVDQIFRLPRRSYIIIFLLYFYIYNKFLELIVVKLFF